MGRPKEFDPDVALAQAVELFWKKGYEAASLGDLTGAMGITKPSLYATFGNKEDLFLRALDYYDQHFMGFIAEALEKPTAWEAIQCLLYGYVDSQTLPDHPRGCLGVHGATPGSEAGEALATELAHRRASVKDSLRQRLERAQLQGDLPLDSNPADLAMFAMMLAQGSAVHARAGGTRDELRQAMTVALTAWPRQKPQGASPRP